MTTTTITSANTIVVKMMMLMIMMIRIMRVFILCTTVCATVRKVIWSIGTSWPDLEK